MIIIAHRGNLNGPNPEQENHPDYIKQALDKFHVEVDVWKVDNQFFLGHDKPQYPIAKKFLQNHRIWVHAKNIEALTELRESIIHCFFHNTDACTLTSQGWIWTYPGKPLLSNRAVAVLPEKFPETDLSIVGAVCTDFPANYR